MSGARRDLLVRETKSKVMKRAEDCFKPMIRYYYDDGFFWKRSRRVFSLVMINFVVQRNGIVNRRISSSESKLLLLWQCF